MIKSLGGRQPGECRQRQNDEKADTIAKKEIFHDAEL
jgi:hypothetical protein